MKRKHSCRTPTRHKRRRPSPTTNPYETVFGTPMLNVGFVRRRDNKSGFVVNGKSYTGVHNYINMLTGTSGEDFDHRWITTGCSRDGIKSGKALDASISRHTKAIIKLTRSKNIPIFDAFDTYIKRRKPHDNTSSTRIIRDMHAMGIVPISTQLPVGSMLRSFATAVDMIGLDRKGRVYIFEIKNGYSTYHRRFVSTMKAGQYHGVPNSAYNRHMLQLDLTCKAFKETYPSSNAIGGAYLIYSCNSESSVVNRHLTMRNNIFYPC